MSGDPASISHLAGASLRSAETLRTRASDLDAARSALDDWGGTVGTRHRRHAQALSQASAGAADCLEDLGRRLQLYATDLAQTMAQIRQIEQAAERADIEVSGGVLVPRFGITGEADAARAHERERAAEELQARWRTALALAERRNDHLRAALAALDRELIRLTAMIEHRLP